MWTKLTPYIATAVIFLALGLYLGRGQVAKTSDVSMQTGTSVVQTRDKVVVVTKTTKPDGTVTETTRTEDIQKTADTKTVDTETKTTSTPVLSKYSLTLGIRPVLNWSEINPQSVLGEYYLGAGMRVLGSAWVEADFQPSTKQLSLGIRIEL